jgi:hypothetical protein
LLDTVWGPKQVAVIHCQGHQKGDALGNQKADKEAKLVALMRGPAPAVLMALFPCTLATYSTHHKNRFGLELKKEIFYQTDNGSLPMAELPCLSC